MRIALLTHQFPGARLGGIGAYTLQAARALAKAGEEVHVFTLQLPDDVRRSVAGAFHLHEAEDIAARVGRGDLPGPLAAATQAGGEAVYRAAIGAALCGALRRVHDKTPFDVVEAAEYESLALPLMIDPLPGSVPVVTHIHSGSAIRRVGNALPATEDALVFDALEFAAIRSADALCAATEKVVEDTRSLVEIDRPVTKIPLPFDFDESRPAVPVTKNGPILFVGRLEALKGIEVLTRALVEFLPRNPHAQILLAGPDTNTATGNTSMAAWIRAQLGPLAKQVTFLGEQRRTEIDALLAQCSFVVVPSLFDNFPYVVCEALGAGRGVIVSDSIGATELAGDAGVPFKRGNPAALAAAMEQLWLNHEKTQALAEAAYRHARQVISSRVTVPARLTFYRTAIAAVRGSKRRSFIEAVSGMPKENLAAVLAAIVRLTATLAGEALPSTITPGSRMLAACERAARDHGTAEIHLFGAGRHTIRLMSERYLWESRGHRIAGIIDDHMRFKEIPEFLGLPVQSPGAFEATLAAGIKPLVVLSTDTFEEQFWEQTRTMRERGAIVIKLYGTTP